MVRELKDNRWKEFSKAEYAVIDCYGENSFACVQLAPIFDAAADELSGVSFGRINISLYPEIADTYGISYDTRTVLKNDGVVEAEGSPKELESSNEYYKLFSKTL